MTLKLIGGDGSGAAPNVVEALEEVLEMAKRGEVVQVGIAYELANGSTTDQFASDRRQHLAKLIGATDLMQHRMRDAAFKQMT